MKPNKLTKYFGNVYKDFTGTPVECVGAVRFSVLASNPKTCVTFKTDLGAMITYWCTDDLPPVLGKRYSITGKVTKHARVAGVPFTTVRLTSFTPIKETVDENARMGPDQGSRDAQLAGSPADKGVSEQAA